jgi:hypothetical protein
MYRSLASCTALLLLPATGFAGELETWVGGGVSAGVQGYADAGTFVDPLATQAEVDGMIGWGWGHARVDFDLHFDPAAEGSEVFLAYPGQYYAGDTPLPMPEWAMVQLGRSKYHARIGILNPNIGLEDWDPWVNYAPIYSTNFVYAGAGRFAGAELSMTTGSGWDVFAFGGYDVDWYAAGGGLGVATSQDSFGTWSGVFVYPQFECLTETCLYVGVALAGEFYPSDAIWVDVDTISGMQGDALFTSEQVVVNIVPEAVVNPFVRGELVIRDAGALPGAPDWTAGGGARYDATGWFRVAAEARAQGFGDQTDFGAGIVVAVHTPEPLPYSFEDPFALPE